MMLTGSRAGAGAAGGIGSEATIVNDSGTVAAAGGGIVSDATFVTVSGIAAAVVAAGGGITIGLVIDGVIATKGSSAFTTTGCEASKGICTGP